MSWEPSDEQLRQHEQDLDYILSCPLPHPHARPPRSPMIFLAFTALMLLLVGIMVYLYFWTA